MKLFFNTYFLKKSILILVLLFSVNFLFAQEEEDSYVYGDTEEEEEVKEGDEKTEKPLIDWNRVSVGGGLGLSFGNVTLIDIAPTAAYFVTDHFLYGVGLNYMYYSDNHVGFQTSSFGARVFSQYLLDILPVLAHVEVEVINADSYKYRGERTTFANVYVGGGLNQKIGDRSYYYMLVLWNLNDFNDSILQQPNPIIRVGIGLAI